MKGSIRVFVGLVTIMGVAGGIDNATDAELFALIPFTIAGFALMLSGVNAMNKQA
jgi:uncharacterized membrane protein